MRNILAVAVILTTVIAAPAVAQRERFTRPEFGNQLDIWRITNDPAVRQHANYHNTQCWSPDGRYLCFTNWGGEFPGSKGTATVHLYDLSNDTDRELEQGISPRWANNGNWLFYVRYRKSDESFVDNGAQVAWLDVDGNELRLLVDGPEMLGETSHDDRWLFGALRYRSRKPEYEVVRIPINKDSRFEKLPRITGSQLMPNPIHPLLFTRKDHWDEDFNSTRRWYDLDGANERFASPMVQKAHMSWIGNGEYLLFGNGLVRGRRWDEPYPSNMHILSSISLGDISPCGRSGRYVCGDNAVADLRSGDGWRTIEPLSIICYPADIGDNSGIYDADPKGSPDGTKICFVTNYDLKDGPITHITKDHRSDSDAIEVASTESFPSAGRLVIGREVIAYKSKTPNTFESISREMYDTVPRSLRADRPVTSFESRLMSDTEWQRAGGHAIASMRKSITDEDSPLVRQRMTDVYVVVVRKPDRPWLRPRQDAAELVPGEEHYETMGYHLLLDDKRITSEPIRAGESFRLAKPGAYRAVAVEWSQLESDPSAVLNISSPTELKILADAPADFSWTATQDEPRDAGVIERITRHLYDGVIRRAWFEDNQLVRHHDLNHKGQATRRVEYADGRIARREYYSSDDNLISRELFDGDKYVIEFVRYDRSGDPPAENDHWWFARGTPLKRARSSDQWVKVGDKWVHSKIPPGN
jgi:hypothetical protein